MTHAAIVLLAYGAFVWAVLWWLAGVCCAVLWFVERGR